MCEIIRQLRKNDVIVQVMMTNSAQKFIGKETFTALSNNEVLTDLFENNPKAGLEHIKLAIEIDAIIVCPSTANVLCKVANGVADDLVTTTLSVCEQKTLYIPAMNYRMWRNEATIKSVVKLRNAGKIVMEPEAGPLASLHKGVGRLPEISSIMNSIRDLFKIPLPLKDKKVLVTAGPTREWIDPVRFISNRSSGKMGYSIAESARDKGANVTLISGPVNLDKVSGISISKVETSNEMFLEIESYLSKNKPDYFFMCAAVSDFKIKSYTPEKIKKSEISESIKIEPAVDILKAITLNNKTRLIAFALETSHDQEEAMRKLNSKNADFIALNVQKNGISGFDSETNEFYVYSKSKNEKKLSLDHKSRIASKLIDHVISCD